MACVCCRPLYLMTTRFISIQIARSRIYSIEDTHGQPQLFRNCLIVIHIN